MSKTYHVIGACVANVPATSANGPQLLTLYTGQVLPADVPADRIEHLLSVRLIEEVGVTVVAPYDPVPPQRVEISGVTHAPVPAPGPTPTPPPAPTPVPAPGSATVPATVNARSKAAELIEYGVRRGDDRAELEALTREQLLARYVRK
ncbi:hypothetical protein [Streptosporangium longisporum]|uniref:Uncharacterized protein n=1 Tax=Streptosporangium longisporum TaxID=46187 RepID=A0ABP6L2V1_9ACTN